jgi:hypothetical protein
MNRFMTTTCVSPTNSFAATSRTTASFDSLWTKGEKVFVLLALLLFSVLSFGSFRSQALTVDELVDVPSGLSYWQKRDTRLNIEHPPLLKMISAIPLLFSHVNVDYSDPSWCGSGNGAECEWVFGKRFFEKWNANPQHLLILARIPMLGIALSLGLLIYALARSLAGPWGGALSLILFATSPFYLGIGSLVLTDIGLPLFILATLWAFASLWLNPNRKNSVRFAVCLACALLSKFSALLLFPTFGLLWLYYRLFSQEQGTADGEQAGGQVPDSMAFCKRFAFEWQAILGIILACVIVFSFYLFTCWDSDPIYIFSQRARTFGIWTLAGRLITHVSWSLPKRPLLARLLSPVWLYFGGVLDVFGRSNRATYLLGKWYAHGLWYYFPVVSFFKLAPGMIGCVALLIVMLAVHELRPRTTRMPLVPARYVRHLEALVVALIVFAGSAILSNLNIGIRHFSVPISIIVLLSALLVPLIKAVLPVGLPRAIGVFGSTALAASSLVTALISYPHYISYYNFFRFGTPKQDIVVNSNLYWGQSLIDLERFREEHHISKMYVDSRTSRLEPSTYVSGASAWRCNYPEPRAPEWLAVDANFLIRDAPTCAGLFRYQHWYMSGESMVVFHVTDSSYADEQWEYQRTHPHMAISVLGFPDEPDAPIRDSESEP